MQDRIEERSLIEAAQSGSDNAKTKLYLAYEKYLYKLARKYANSTVSVDDLVQHGAVGLLEAINSYDLSRTDGANLVTYAKTRIVNHFFGCINTMQRDFRLFTSKSLRKAFSNIARYRDGQSYLSQEKRQQMANDLDIREEDIINLEKRLYSGRIAIHDETGEDGALYSDTITDNSCRPDDAIMTANYHKVLSESLSDALLELDARSRDIIIKRMLPEDGQKVTLKSLAEEFGVKHQRIDQIQKNAYKKMQSKLEHLC